MFKITFPQIKKTVKGHGTILEIAKDGKIFIPSPCGGRGICKKCKVRVEGRIRTSEDKIITSGLVLACQSHPDGNIKVWFEKEPDVPEQFSLKYTPPFSSPLPHFTSESEYLIACDIGTTTISLSLWQANRRHIKSITFTNPQKKFGDDVITRVTFGTTKTGKRLLHSTLINRIKNIIEELPFKPLSAVFTGNSVMLYTLVGRSLKPFSRRPYRFPFRGDKLVNIIGMKVYIPPLISSFIGADFLTGLTFILKEENQPFIYIDIGTNTEIGIFTGKNIIATSTPAGSALEGMHITSGIPPIRGAIQHVRFNRDFVFESSGTPIGISGSGLIDLIAVFLQTKIIDSSGTLNLKKASFYGFQVDEKNRIVFIQPDVSFTQEDIRKFQLTKASIRSGCEMIIQKSGIDPSEIKKCYLAGSFGKSININSFKRCGFLPKEFKGKIVKTGNSALKGALEILFSDSFMKMVKSIPKTIMTVQLPQIPEFEKSFLAHLQFDT